MLKYYNNLLTYILNPNEESIEIIDNSSSQFKTYIFNDRMILRNIQFFFLIGR
jgi:hypothetical protein